MARTRAVRAAEEVLCRLWKSVQAIGECSNSATEGVSVPACRIDGASPNKRALLGSTLEDYFCSKGPAAGQGLALFHFLCCFYELQLLPCRPLSFRLYIIIPCFCDYNSFLTHALFFNH